MYNNCWFKDIRKIYPHPEFNHNISALRSPEADIAVLELESAIRPQYVKPACLPLGRGVVGYDGDLLVSFEMFKRLN